MMFDDQQSAKHHRQGSACGLGQRSGEALEKGAGRRRPLLDFGEFRDLGDKCRARTKPRMKRSRRQGHLELHASIVGTRPAQAAMKRWEIGQAQRHRAEPADRANRPQLRAALRDIVEVSRIMARADHDARAALRTEARELAALREFAVGEVVEKIHCQGFDAVAECTSGKSAILFIPLTKHPVWTGAEAANLRLPGRGFYQPTLIAVADMTQHSLPPCSARGCVRAPSIIMNNQLLCAPHATAATEEPDRLASPRYEELNDARFSPGSV